MACCGRCKRLTDKIGAYASITKIIMSILFLILFALGAALFIVCVVAKADSNDLGELDISSITGLLVMGIILGLFLAIVSLLGLFGYVTLHKGILIFVTCAIVLLAALQITCGGLALGYKDDYDDIFADAWDGADNHTRAVIENKFKCCGGKNFTDAPALPKCVHYTSESSESYGSSVSSSVVSSAPPASQSSVPPTSYELAEAMKDGCVSELVEFANDNFNYVGAGVIVITVLEIAVIVLCIVILIKIGQVTKYNQVGDDDDNVLEVLHSK